MSNNPKQVGEAQACEGPTQNSIRFTNPIFELMKPQDIEVRPATIQNGKTKLLLYQNSRTAMEALDKVVGPMNWQIEYYNCGEMTFGKLSIYDDAKKEWVSKSDTGEVSNISERKGLSSDILKRCAVRFGFARELYSAPAISVASNDKYMTYKVQEIEYNDMREISHLVIVDKTDTVVFDWSNNNNPSKDHIQRMREDLKAYCTQKKFEGVDKKDLLAFFKYYEKKVSKDGWNNSFRPDALFKNWMARKGNRSE